MQFSSYLPQPQGLYHPQHEHDACGVGMVCDIKGRASHDIVLKGMTVLERLLHRGAAGSDPDTGDGAGILIQLPHAFLEASCPDISFPEPGCYGAACVFLPTDDSLASRCMKIAEDCILKDGFRLLGWRTVPVNLDAIGVQARLSAPSIRQFFIVPGNEQLRGEDLERSLYILRRTIERTMDEALPELGDRFYIASLSARTLIYKGLLKAPQLPRFYQDLTDPRLVSAVAVVHQRYSTNTFPSWPLAHPFHMLAHNGEVNTIKGNINQMNSRENFLSSPLFGENISRILPVIRSGQSDSACLDNVLELLVRAGRSLPHAMMMLIPQAWGSRHFMSEDVRGFFDFHAGIMEPWDGPAAVCFTDGLGAGAMVDRNGLRPVRYTVTSDGLLVLASEAGVLDQEPALVIKRGCLHPGQMLWVDFAAGRIAYDSEIKTHVSRLQPYRRWCEENRIHVHGFFDSVMAPTVNRELLPSRHALFGYTKEDLELILSPMAKTGVDPIGSMGNDTPLAVMSERPQLLFNYFKQLFAQVTNPPIDPIREELVMSLTTFIGNPPNILEETPAMARLIKLDRPILTSGDLDRLRECKEPDFRSLTLELSFDASAPDSLETGLDDLCARAEKAVRTGYSILILSDRNLPPDKAPIPSLLAVSAVNAHLVNLGLRTGSGLIVDTGEARETMHFALLLGYGATAICPYLAIETITKLWQDGALGESISEARALTNYIKALDKGLLKIMSKMGISTLRSYRRAQVFEAIGLDRSMVDRYFAGTESRVGGIGLKEVGRETLMRYEASRQEHIELENAGIYKYRKGGEKHLWTSELIGLFQRAVRNADYGKFKEFTAKMDDASQNLCTLRGLFRFKETTPVPLEEVESALQIVKRFVSGAMSLGAISREAHESIAIAMNRLGSMSNSGEGGEDPARYIPLENGDSLCSAIKQVASGRFGVTAEYLAHAKEIQIKIAQGAKPGEGGQLPGGKVNEEIARVRHSTPGVTLISPPPHHDIYSIEDLAQLIYDLKNANPEARISVKLVSEVGVGTVAAGVAKGGADMVLVSGHDGGTGASPLTSIMHAGLPWELGLAETQQTLVLNNLRGSVRLQTDGQLKTGRDVIIATLLGAEEYGFATSVLIAMGCVLMRVCQKNSCPVGVATQDPELRKKFRGKPEYIVHFLMFVAEEVREYLARLGFRSIDEAVGRTDLLDINPAIEYWKTRNLDFSSILSPVANQSGHPVRFTTPHDHGVERFFDGKFMEFTRPALESGRPVEAAFPVANTDRSVGTMLSGKVALAYGHEGLPDDTVRLHFRGTAGQSFGAFLAHGVTLTLTGEANDYLGKGLSGGRIIVRPFEAATYSLEDNIIAGNVLLYGAINGTVFINGAVGERFAVRNSGATAVVEGTGNHCCEYMTGGTVVVLGPTGVNFGAGMSGGFAYVLDEDGSFDRRCNLSTIDLEPVKAPEDVARLHSLIEEHAELTGSPLARRILESWDDVLPKFVKVFPMEYRRVLSTMNAQEVPAPQSVHIRH